jgi:Zn-dependent alcohol dehydrogenase
VTHFSFCRPPGAARADIKASGVCHTDEYTCSGAHRDDLFPATSGHEGGVPVHHDMGYPIFPDITTVPEIARAKIRAAPPLPALQRRGL